MIPGSGASDRHNDVFFPPIRSDLLAHRVAVASFDKRGSGGSSGSWTDADIAEQVADAIAAGELLRAEVTDIPIGLFGHSQGGWVALEAASRDGRLAFVVANAGPGVTPGEQDRFALESALRRSGAGGDDLEAALSAYDGTLELLRSGASFDDFQSFATSEELAQTFGIIGEYAPVAEDAAAWEFARRIIDYDPAPALRRIGVPVLALFGGGDRLVPVEASVAVYRESVPDERLTVHVFAGADHRCQVGDPPTMAPGYLELLNGWIAGVVIQT